LEERNCKLANTITQLYNEEQQPTTNTNTQQPGHCGSAPIQIEIMRYRSSLVGRIKSHHQKPLTKISSEEKTSNMVDNLHTVTNHKTNLTPRTGRGISPPTKGCCTETIFEMLM
jgi:hypothetical protein